MTSAPTATEPTSAVTIRPSAAAWLSVAWEGIVALAALAVGVGYLAGTALTEWVDGEFEQGRTGRLGLVMRVPAPVWAWVAVGLGVAFAAFAVRAVKKARGGAVVLTATRVSGGLEIAAGPWADAEGSLVVAPGAALDLEEYDAGDDGWQVVARSQGAALTLTTEADLDSWDASALVEALAAQGSSVKGLPAV